jgi:hypothetical protein
MTTDRRDTVVRLRVTRAEADRLADQAVRERRSLSDWIRDRLGLPLRDEVAREQRKSR